MIDWCTAAAPAVSVIDGAQSNDLTDLEVVEVGAARFVGRASVTASPHEYFATSSCLYSLPVSVRGSCASKEIERGHL